MRSHRPVCGYFLATATVTDNDDIADKLRGAASLHGFNTLAWQRV